MAVPIPAAPGLPGAETVARDLQHNTGAAPAQCPARVISVVVIPSTHPSPDRAAPRDVAVRTSGGPPQWHVGGRSAAVRRGV